MKLFQREQPLAGPGQLTGGGGGGGVEDSNESNDTDSDSSSAVENVNLKAENESIIDADFDDDDDDDNNEHDNSHGHVATLPSRPRQPAQKLSTLYSSPPNTVSRLFKSSLDSSSWLVSSVSSELLTI
jgi:hypothetical protein